MRSGLITMSSAWSAATPPPMNVRASAITAIDAVTASEGIVCIADAGPVSYVEAAIFSRGKVTIFTKSPKYDGVMLCVKDWITQVNSGHRDHMAQPKNVQLAVAHASRRIAIEAANEPL